MTEFFIVVLALVGGGLCFLGGQVAGRFAGFKEGMSAGFVDGYNTALWEEEQEAVRLEDEEIENRTAPEGTWTLPPYVCSGRTDHEHKDGAVCEECGHYCSECPDTTILPPKGDA